MMSLSAQEQHALESIEDGLASAAPELAALLATFTRLASGEDMPTRERIRPAGQQAAEHIGRGLREGWRRMRRPLDRKRTFLLLWLTVAISLIAVALTLNHSLGRGGCTGPWPAACAGQAFAHGTGLVVPGQL